MFDNHRAPSIPPRAIPPGVRPSGSLRIIAIAGLVSLPLMLVALSAGAPALTVLLLGLTQTAFLAVTTALILDARGRGTAQDQGQRPDHG